jgi:hypothetical protein
MAARLAAAVTAVAVGLSGCSGGDEHAARSAPPRSSASALRVVERPIPRLRVAGYHTHGRWPHVASRDRRLKKVNAALFNVLRIEQRRYARFARRHARLYPPPRMYRDTGVFEMSPRRDLISASSVVVSAMVAERALLPAGNDGDGWQSVTVPVAIGSPIAITDLFARPREGLRALATAARKHLLRTNRCVRDEQRQGFGAEGFAPKPRRYRHFALTPTGLAVGFDLGYVAAPFCGRSVTVVPYSEVSPYLSDLGGELVAGVRRPTGP